MKRGEGVAIVLAGSAIRAGGSRWKAWGSRLITTTSETGRGSSGHLHITSCYAPTIPASREEKDEFLTHPSKHCLQSIRREQCGIGDFNA